MRNAFIKELCECAKTNRDIWLLTADLGFSVLESFRDNFSDRYINVGVAEQNMIGLAAGLALSGKIVFCYSIANFGTMRCYEQIRNDVCYHNLNVAIITVGGGYIYGSHGVTHHVTEDIGALRVLPNIKVVVPGDPLETTILVRRISKGVGPVYLRLSKANDPILHKKDVTVDIGKAIEVSKGKDLVMLATGGILENAVKSLTILNKKGISVNLWSVPFIKPFDDKRIFDSISEKGRVVTVEEHSLIGGLKSALAETLLNRDIKVKCLSLGIPDEFTPYSGNRKYLLGKYSLSPEGIAEKVINFLPS